MKKIISIIGARPQIIKSAAISRAIANHYADALKEIVVHTGQHYDTNMSDIFFGEMNIPKPQYNLAVGSGSHAIQTAEMLVRLEEVVNAEKPDALLVYGDTNSTLAGATVASKLGIPVIHIEAGLRSFNKSMPEEINRIVCDHLSTLLFSPTQTGVDNLKREGFLHKEDRKTSPDNPKVFLCGDIMYDNSMYFSTLADEKATVLQENNLEKDNFYLCTIHRGDNTDNPENLTAIFEALLEISAHDKDAKIVLPLHPRTKKCIEQLENETLKKTIFNHQQLMIKEPVSFFNIIALEKNCKMVITDSGGLQKEAFFFKKPCVILRPETEWVEIVENGNAKIVNADKAKILDAVTYFNTNTDFTYPAFYGDAKAAEFICSEILKLF